MAREQKISSGILNVRLHPHPDNIYTEFAEALYDLKQPVKLRGDRFGMISILNRKGREEGFYEGVVTTFTRIDENEPWFNAKKLSEATDDDVSQISIPEGLFPNSNSFYFIFDVEKHRIFAQTYSKGKTLSINTYEKLFRALADELSIQSRFGDAKITVVQSRAGLERIFSLPQIRRLEFVIEAPNADVFDENFDENIERFLRDIDSKKMEIAVTAERGETVKPNEQLERVGRSALENGKITAQGRDLDGPQTISSTDYPKKLQDSYDPDKISESQAMRRLSGR